MCEFVENFGGVTRKAGEKKEWGEEKCPRAVGSAVKVFPELVQERLGLVSLLVGYFLVCLTKSKGNCGTTPGLNAKLI